MGGINVILEDYGSSKIGVIKLYMELTGAELKEAKEKIDSVPCVFMENLSEEKANSVVKRLKGEGVKARIELVGGDGSVGDNMKAEENKQESSKKEYEFKNEEKKETSKAKKIENATLGALEKVSGIITTAIGFIAFLLLLLDYGGFEIIARIFSILVFALLLWFCVLKRYVTYFLNSLENEFLYERDLYNPDDFFEFIKNNIKYDGVEKLETDENEQCIAICKFGTHHFEYNPEEEKVYVTFECGKKFPYYTELCNMIEANCIAKSLKDALYGSNEAEVKRNELDKIYRVHRLGKLTPLYIILGIVLLAGPKNIKTGIQMIRYPEIKTVQDGTMEIFGDAPIKKVLENFFGDPMWRYEKDVNENGYVVFSGTATQTTTNMRRDFEIYFKTKRLDGDMIQYEVKRVTIDNEDLSDEEIIGLLLRVIMEYVDGKSEQDTANDFSENKADVDTLSVEREKSRFPYAYDLYNYLISGEKIDVIETEYGGEGQIPTEIEGCSISEFAFIDITDDYYPELILLYGEAGACIIHYNPLNETVLYALCDSYYASTLQTNGVGIFSNPNTDYFGYSKIIWNDEYDNCAEQIYLDYYAGEWHIDDVAVSEEQANTYYLRELNAPEIEWSIYTEENLKMHMGLR